MANKTYTYDVTWAYKEDGNRAAEGTETVKATTVQRAISKAVKQLNEGIEADSEDFIRASDILVIAVDNKGWKSE